jgi:hypothetical protein
MNPARISARPAANRRRLVFSICSFALLAALGGCEFGTSNGNQEDMGTPPDMTTPPMRFGFVRAGSTAFQPATQSMASAFFIDTTATGAGCSRTVQGSCTVYRCTGSGFRYPSAGNVSIGPKSGVGFMLMASTDGYYVEARNTSASAFASGQAVSFVAAGKEVPAFTSEVTLPADMFTISSPTAARDNLGWVIGRTADFPITWTTTSSQVAVELTQGTDQAFGGVTVRCTFPGNAGTGTLPAGVLGSLKAMTPTRILLGPVVSTKVQKDGWEIDAIAIGVGRNGDVEIQ